MVARSPRQASGSATRSARAQCADYRSRSLYGSCLAMLAQRGKATSNNAARKKLRRRASLPWIDFFNNISLSRVSAERPLSGGVTVPCGSVSVVPPPQGLHPRVRHCPAGHEPATGVLGYQPQRPAIDSPKGQSRQTPIQSFHSHDPSPTLTNSAPPTNHPYPPPPRKRNKLQRNLQSMTISSHK